ncbi:MAG TPA: exonuclease domain-containing protein [Candidatus Saccharimonadia bacterium]|nr:exonuclease domain-containing protein [Candidatus Saccharimonadia bacterium]
MSYVLHQPLVFVDIETTGGSHFTSRVLEVGVVRVENAQIVAKYRTLLQPDEDIPPWITSLTGITDEDVSDAPRFTDIADELAEILDGATFVAHNVRFDHSFLKMEFERLDVPFRPPLLCTVKLSRRLFPQFKGHKLADLISRHGLVAPARHRAYDDAHCLWQFYQVILHEFDLDTVELAIKSQLGASSIPSQLDRGQVEQLPEGPGVYIFENDEGAPLYVGKSVAVKRRVLSHFSSDYESGSELKLASQVKVLRGIATHGELSALLLESHLIKELQPMYNRKSRQRARVTVVMSGFTDDGYATAAICDTSEILPEDGARLLTVYTTVGRAKLSLGALARRYRLCPKLIGLERTSGASFQSQLGWCLKACEGLEAPDAYNLRFDAAFERQRVAAWPYSGSILIRERHAALPGSSGYIVDNWCLLGRLKELEDGTVETEDLLNQFDLDNYRIIRRFVTDMSNRQHISVLSKGQVRELLMSFMSYY